MEEQLKDSEIQQLAKLQAALDDHSVGTNPLYEHVEVCEHLKKYCQKRIKTAQEEETKVVEAKEEKKVQGKNELDKALEKGSIQLAPKKEEGTILVGGGKQGKSKKNRKNAQQDGEGFVEFATIKKFNSLKISVPMNENDYERAIKDLDELKDALIYWGKIIQRQSKIKYIRNSRKIGSDEEYANQAAEEEKFIEQEKAKYSSEDTSQHTLNNEKLKIAQVIDRESRINKAWNDVEDEDDAVFDSAGEEQEERREERREKKPKQSKRPNA